MKRPCLLVLAALALAFGLAAGPSPAAAQAISLSYANFPPASTFPCVQMERWKTEVEKRTGGKVSVQTFPGSTLLGAKDMFRGVEMGQADIGCLSVAYQPGVFPFSMIGEQPIGFTSATVASVVMWELFVKYQPKEFGNVHVLTMFTSAPSQIMSKAPVRSLADLKGMELRSSGTISKLIGSLGATPVSMPMSEAPEALQKGVVKGIISSLEVLKDFNYAELCRFETMTDLPVYPFAVVMNKDKWESLPPEVKKIMDDLGREQALWTGQYMDGHVKESVAWSKEKYAIEIIDLPAADKAEIEAKSQGLIDEWKKIATGAGLPADALLADLKAFKAKYEAEYGK
jgi:TRAP-type C4-dicarboxylate transport system substrate-binding protein